MIRRQQPQPQRNASSRAGSNAEKNMRCEQKLCQQVPLANTPVGGTECNAGRRSASGLGDRKTVKLLVTVRRSTSMEASTAALSPLQETLLRQQGAPRHPASGHKLAKSESFGSHFRWRTVLRHLEP